MPAEHDTHELRQQILELQLRAKYTQKERDDMAGHEALPDGSYPIKDAEDLANAIHAVGRGGDSHNAIRVHIMDRAKALGLEAQIPDNWQADGSLKVEAKSTTTPEARANDDDPGDCSTCDGTGKIKAGTTTCPTCNGTGKQTDEAESKPRIESVRERKPEAAREQLHHVREQRVSVRREFELREIPNGTGGTNLRFSGFASVTGDDAAYEMEDWIGSWVESVSVGAFTKTLADGADVSFLVNHSGMTLARTKPGTLKLSEVTEGRTSPIPGVTGLHSEAMLDPDNPQVIAVRSAIERGDLDEMSFAFRVIRQEWSTDYDRRRINEVTLDKGDVSLVNYGANPNTAGTVDMRQRLQSRDRFDVFGVLAAATAELRAGKTISAKTAATLQGAYPHLDAMGAASAGIKSMVDDLIAMNSPDPEDEVEAAASPLAWFRSWDSNIDRARLEANRNRRAA